MGALEQFFWGFIGGLTIDIPSLSRALSAGRDLPDRFLKASYWFGRVLVAAVAGCVAVAFQAPSPLVAFHVGVAAPIMMERWQKKAPGPLS